MGDLTETFSRKEFACKCNCGFDAINIGLVHRLQLVRDIARIPIKINSGCRCFKHNENSGGQTDSYHLRGEAIDWCFFNDEDALLEKLCTKLLDNWSGGFHFYSKRVLPSGIIQSEFCHSDIGPRRRWA